MDKIRKKTKSFPNSSGAKPRAILRIPLTKATQPHIVIDCIVANRHDKTILIQQRSSTRKLFPLCWDFLGGHQEPGETAEECMNRELLEEGNVKLVRIITKLHEFYWSFNNQTYKDIVYLIEAQGDLRLEAKKAIAFKWIKRDEAHLLLKPGDITNGLYEAALKAFDVLNAT